MSDYLETNLAEKVKDKSQLKLLESQWAFDKVLIPKALQQVGQLFPHYSRHDHSHSEKILTNIERMLGVDRVNTLSATDTWLLLEAAYWHDIGMVVPHDELQKALEKPEFELYRQEVISDNSNELQNFALHFNAKDLSKAFLGADSPLDAVSKFRLFMAEWFRREHTQRSARSVNDPWQELGVSSPRTELIPKRLFRLLGEICSLHGESFLDVINKLPYKATGVGNDDCHPRFVACMLRLGDLLDMDDNRFCPVMQRIAGDKRPALSKAHEDKHASIRHFRLDPERIEITAVCKSLDGYLEQWRWIDYLRQEIKDQMARWQDISPSPDLGLLPTLGDMEVKIAGTQLITEQGVRPQFSVNSEKIMSMLKGDNLYNKIDTVREILQNAVDATLLRIWLDIKRVDNEFNIKSMQDIENFKNSYSRKYPIKVTLEKVDDSNKPLSNNKIEWKLTIIDEGIGIKKKDINFLMKMANSSNNIERQIIINEMPEYLKPSGTFGIGLQSIFMWTDVATLKTRSIDSSHGLDITIHSPNGEKRGLVLVESVENAYHRGIGTELSFNFLTDKLSLLYSISERNFIQKTAINNYDSLLDEELPLTACELIEAIVEFRKGSPVEVKIHFKNDSKSINNSLLLDEDKNTDDVVEVYKNSSIFIERTVSEFSVILAGRRQPLIYFRGQLIKDAKPIRYPFFSYKLNLHKGKAGSWITFSRNNLTDEGEKNVAQNVALNFKIWAQNKIEEFEKLERVDSKQNENILNSISLEKAYLSLIARYWKDVQGNDDEDRKFWKNIEEVSLKDNWKELTCSIYENGQIGFHKYADIFNKSIANFFYIGRSHHELRSKFLLDSGCKIIIAHETILINLIIKEWCRDGSNIIKYVKVIEIIEHPFDRRELPSDKLFIKLVSGGVEEVKLEIDDVTLAFAIEESFRQVHFGKRLVLPQILFPEFNILAIKSGIISYGFLYPLPYMPKLDMDHIVLPFEIHRNKIDEISITLNRLNEFLRWVEDHLKINLSYSDIEKAYRKIIDYFDNELMANSNIWKEARNR